MDSCKGRLQLPRSRTHLNPTLQLSNGSSYSPLSQGVSEAPEPGRSIGSVGSGQSPRPDQSTAGRGQDRPFDADPAGDRIVPSPGRIGATAS